jgi:hypothetical protein
VALLLLSTALLLLLVVTLCVARPLQNVVEVNQLHCQSSILLQQCPTASLALRCEVTVVVVFSMISYDTKCFSFWMMDDGQRQKFKSILKFK